MKCRDCGEEYIGDTGNFLRKRVTVHNQHVRDPKTRMLKVSEHIDNCANLLEPKCNIFPFYKMYTDSVTLRRSKEKLFINSLQPKLNSHLKGWVPSEYSYTGNVIYLKRKR